MAKQSTTTRKRPAKRENNGARTRAAGGYQFGELIEGREVESVFGALAVGFCVGVALGAALSRPGRQETWVDRVTAEGLGRRVMGTLERILPEAISDRLHA